MISVCREFSVETFWVPTAPMPFNTTQNALEHYQNALYTSNNHKNVLISVLPFSPPTGLPSRLRRADASDAALAALGPLDLLVCFLLLHSTLSEKKFKRVLHALYRWRKCLLMTSRCSSTLCRVIPPRTNVH